MAANEEELFRIEVMDLIKKYLDKISKDRGWIVAGRPFNHICVGQIRTKNLCIIEVKTEESADYIRPIQNEFKKVCNNF